MKLSFHGAAQDVTGSCRLRECAGVRILVDCGLFQGIRKLAAGNHAAFAIERAQEILFHLQKGRSFWPEMRALPSRRMVPKLRSIQSERVNG